ncbi:hypothetical protein Poly51_23860 [Rubripirellula tenax]|uniref:Tetratricopeptide repeat protein n=1 Tax=Rubripirellula tenax TaxID=2528015 RepID=A0A5C6F5G7_9BACT|nr:hypothetical protein [Rubripirellula tenax]TWU56475.1 hypothetical protein Poly51_23860 [Rubripirellula tenax]
MFNRIIAATAMLLITIPIAVAQTTGGISGPFGSLNFTFGQSSSQSIVGTSPSLTTLDGYPGSFMSGTIRPFVVGLTPVVGNYPVLIDRSVEATRNELTKLYRSQAALADKRLIGYLQRGEQAEAAGNMRMAKANYRRAIRLASEPLRSELMSRLRK